MKRALLFVVTVFLCAAAQAAGVQQITPSELSLAGIVIGQTEAEVINLLGKPRSRSKTDEGYRLSYKGMDIYVGVGSYGVFDLTSTNPTYCTKSHICPGMPVSKLRSKFGPGIEAKRESGNFLEYTPHESTCWLQIREAEGIIQSIRIACQP